MVSSAQCAIEVGLKGKILSLMIKTSLDAAARQVEARKGCQAFLARRDT